MEINKHGKLLAKIATAEAKLKFAEMDCITWGQDKYKDYMLLELAKIHVNNYKKELARLREELKSR